MWSDKSIESQGWASEVSDQEDEIGEKLWE